MKIEDFQLKMSSKYEHTLSVTSSFENELEFEQLQRNDKIKETAEIEKQFSSKIHLMLIQQLLKQLNIGSYEQNREDYSYETKKEQTIHTTSNEFQKLELNMGGFIQTDTQKIAIDISVCISHTLIVERDFEASHCIDPLIINLEGEIPSLNDTSFHFDIDNDGLSDQISTLASGNGFLALDRNENGIIDNGSELFGTKLGNGFAELSMFDSDNNLWIDENDPILDKLRIWIKTDNKNELLSLGEVGIGAIYLGQTRSSFSYKNEEKHLGELRSSGFFLYEDAKSGIISQIDLAKEEPLANLILST